MARGVGERTTCRSGTIRDSESGGTSAVGAIIVLAGPDGSGKSTVADRLAEVLVPPFTGVVRQHWRPHLLPRPGAVRGGAQSDVTRPHDLPRHPRWVSLGLVVYCLLDFWLGHLLRHRASRRRGHLVLVERGWHDMAVDPQRYRLDVSPGLVQRLGRLLPRPDAHVVLVGDPALLHARKSELPVDEIGRQQAAWRRFALRRPEALVVDVGQPVDRVVAAISARLIDHATSARSPGWVAMPRRAAPRLQVPRTPRAAAVDGLRLYQPTAGVARAATTAAAAAARTGMFRLVPGQPLRPAWLVDRLGPYVPPGGTMAVLAANHPDRWVARLLDRTGRPVAVAKVVGPDGDPDALAREAAALDGLACSLPAPLRAPPMLAHAAGVLVVEAVVPRPRRSPCVLPAAVAGALGIWFAAGANDAGRGPAHGDCAPWNLLRTHDGWVLVDWEHARPDGPAFQDVLHYVVQGHALVGEPRQGELVHGVRDGVGWVGAAIDAYASAAGLPATAAFDALRVYLSTSHEMAGPDGRPEGHSARVALLEALA